MSGSEHLPCPAPVLAVCGFSGSGKTTLLEAVIPHLIERGLSIAVVKHDAHGFQVDHAGKDSDRIFRAGATVALRGPGEQFQRRGASAALSIAATVCDFGRDHDLVLVEGHKDTPLPKVWLRDQHDTQPLPDVTEIAADLAWDSDRLAAFISYIDSWLPQAWNRRPVFGALLIGGQSARMGSPKQLLEIRGKQMGVIVADALRECAVCRQVVAVGASLGKQRSVGGRRL